MKIPWITSALVADLDGKDKEILLERSAEVRFDELARQMQPRRIDGFDARLRHGDPVDAGEGGEDDQRYDDDH